MNDADKKKLRKTQYEKELMDIVHRLYLPVIPRKQQEIALVGSYAYRNRYRYADLDFHLQIPKQVSANTLAKALRAFAKRSPYCYAELNIKYTDDNNGKESERRFDQNDVAHRVPMRQLVQYITWSTFIKTEMFVFFQNRIVETTMVYRWKGGQNVQKKTSVELKEQIEKAKKEKDYFKLLKRKASLTGKECYMNALNGALGVANEARAIADAIVASKLCSFTREQKAIAEDTLLQRLTQLGTHKVPNDATLNAMARNALRACGDKV